MQCSKNSYLVEAVPGVSGRNLVSRCSSDERDVAGLPLEYLAQQLFASRGTVVEALSRAKEVTYGELVVSGVISVEVVLRLESS